MSDGYIYQAGQSEVADSFVLTKLASSSNASAIATPFSNLLIANNISIYKNSGYSTTAKATSLVFEPSNNLSLGFIRDIVIRTNSLATNAACKVMVLVNGEVEGTARYVTVSTGGQIMHVFKNVDIPDIKNFKVVLDWSVGSNVNKCDIREVYLTGITKEV
jgi:hypothetical protein